MSPSRLVIAALAVSLAPVALAQSPTYAKDVFAIFQAKCQICHRTGDVAPFALYGYEDAVNWSEDIRKSIDTGSMPPWKPVENFGDFRDSYALTAAEKQTILSWIDHGMPFGDPYDMPHHSGDVGGGWPLGDPDLVLGMPAAFTPPRGKDVYRCFVLPETGLDKTTYLSAIDVIPGNRQIVHHVLIYVDTTGTAASMDGKDGDPGYSCFGGPGIPIDGSNLLSALDSLSGLGGWAPGQRTHHLPDGVGLMLPGKARVVIQVHYYPIGRTGPDQTQIGLYIAKTQVKKRLYHIPVLNQEFKIAPNTVQDVTAVFPPYPLPLSAQAITIYPHMHLLGRKIKAELIRQDGSVQPMIYEDNWNFNWQGAYTYTEPVTIPFYSKVKVTCTFDNTANNPRNPNNPLVTVGWGERTTDEMCLAFLGVTIDNDPFTVLQQIRPIQ